MEHDALAHKVCEKLFDVLFGQLNPGFADQCGGLEKLEQEVRDALKEYHSSLPEQDCRDVI